MAYRIASMTQSCESRWPITVLAVLTFSGFYRPVLGVVSESNSPGNVLLFAERTSLLLQWQRGHRCYLPLKWLDYTSDEPYEFDYQGGCEPYTINLNLNMADYDERYRGRYFDKVSQVQHMALLGARFFVDPHNFLVHVPHPQTVYSYTLIDWYPANQDQLCLTNTLLHIHANEVSFERNSWHHYSRIAASQVRPLSGLSEVLDVVVPRAQNNSLTTA